MHNRHNLRIFASLAYGFLCFALLVGCNLKNGSRLDQYRQGGHYSGGNPSPSPDGKNIVYSSPRSGNGDLYRVNIDGTGTVRLTSDPRYECDATYSPDGMKIAFIREDDDEGNVWIMNADGTGYKQLTKGHGDEGGPKFSPDGSQIVFWRTVSKLKSRIGSTKARELFLINVNTNAETRLTDNEREDVFPVISPDGKKVGFTKEDRTWIMNLNGKNGKSLGPGSQPSFSPDGKQITFVAGQFGRQITVMNVDGSQLRVIFSKDTTVSHPEFVPDGASVVFLEHPVGRTVGDIMVVRLDDSHVRRVTRAWGPPEK